MSERNGTTGLLCCLVGFDQAGAGAVRRSAQKSGLQLSAEWTFQTELSGVCDLLICDTDTHAGEKAWRATAGRIRVRAMATSDADVPDGLLLRKPFQQGEPEGLIHVLNEAARIQSARSHDRKCTHLGVTTPAPAPSSQAAMMPRASATAASSGAKVALHTSTWPGWMRVLPSKPRSRPWTHSVVKPSMSLTSL